jgi:membrane protein
MSTKDLLSILKTTFSAWNKHEAPRLGAALAFYTILSLSPLVIIVVALAGLIFSRSTAQAHILSQVQGMIGSCPPIPHALSLPGSPLSARIR